MILSDFIWLVSGHIFKIIVSLVAIRLSTSVLSSEEYGLLAVLISFQAFSGLILINPIGQYIKRNTHEWTRQKVLFAKLRKYRMYVLFASICGGAAIALWAVTRLFDWQEQTLYALLIVFTVLSVTWNATCTGILNMLGCRSDSVLWAAITAIIGLVSSYSLIVVFGDRGWAWFAGQSVGMCIGAFGASCILKRELPNQELTETNLLDKYIIRSYILPLAIATGFMWWLVSGYRLVLEVYWGLGMLGMVAVGFGLASQLWSVAETLAIQFLYPLYYRRIASDESNDSQKAFSDLLNTLGPMYLVLASAAIVTAPALLKVFISSAYHNISFFLQLGIFFEMARVFGSLLGSAAQINKMMKSLILPYVLGGGTMLLLLIYIGTMNMGIKFAALALVVSSVIMLLVMIFEIKNLVLIEVDRVRWIMSGILLPASMLFSYFIGSEGGDMIEALSFIGLVGISVMVILLALLWKNQAVERMLSVRLND